MVRRAPGADVGVNVLLVGAGGHAKAVYEAVVATGDSVTAYADVRPAGWLAARHWVDDQAADREEPNTLVVIGIGGATPESLRSRLAVLERYVQKGRTAPTVMHRTACVSPAAVLGPGVTVLAGAVVQPSAEIGRGAIVNTRAVVEHDSTIGAGSHVAPGAVVLGDCVIGECVMIGAGAVVLPGSAVPDDTLIPALSRYPR